MHVDRQGLGGIEQHRGAAESIIALSAVGVNVRFDSAIAVADATDERLARGPWSEGASSNAMPPGHVAGTGRRQSATVGEQGVVVHRDVFAAADGSPWWAVRLVIENGSGETIRIGDVTPVAVDADGLDLGEVPVPQWAYIRQPRQKNDMPAAIRLGDTGAATWDAVRGTPETGGVPGGVPGAGGDDAVDAPTRFISSEVSVLAAGETALLVTVLPMHEQLVSQTLDISATRDRLESLTVTLHGDEQELAAGGTWSSQWVLLDATHGPGDVLDAAADVLLAAQRAAGVEPRPRADRPATVWCSWYYFGDGFSQAECEANLDWLAKHPLPVDVVQIDECWDQRWGDWEPNGRWPDLPGVAKRIAAMGYRPGLWSCPFLAESRSTVRYQNPHWLLRDASGEPVRFHMNKMDNCVLDPTHPEVQAFLEATFRRFTRTWGYTYHKIDFTRAVATPGVVYHDATKNRAQAFRMGLTAIRRGIGDAGYLNVCGGLYGPGLGLADAQRSGSDVKSEWLAPPTGDADEPFGPFTIKQNVLRGWMNRLWENDPDALMVRRRSDPYRDEKLSLGLLTDEEALTSTLNQYLGGGIVCLTEHLPEIDADRLMLLRHASPSIGVAAVPLQWTSGERFPSVMLTHVTPRAKGLRPWVTISFVNWLARPAKLSIPMHAVLASATAAPRASVGFNAGSSFVASSFRRQNSWCVSADGTLETGELPPHGCEVIKLQVASDGPLLLHGNGHFSMGGVEVLDWNDRGGHVAVTVDWPWPTPMHLAFARSLQSIDDPEFLHVAGPCESSRLTLEVS